MAEAAWGSVTAKSSGGGSSDPNVLTLGDNNKVRILDKQGARKWRQHGIQSPTDDEQFRSATCPRGPEGKDPGTCPLCMKPVDAGGAQRFPVSRRFACNVWDYETNSVKVLIAGPQVFDEFDAFAQVGQDPTATDWIIFKSGEKKQTTYKVVPVPGQPPVEITQDMLHDLDKYEEASSADKIFELLEQLGIDYDALETPSYTLEQAEAMQIPYGKHKGWTMEQLYANEKGYMEFLHSKKLEQGQLGDPVFVAFQTILEHHGDVPPLDTMPATTAPRPAASPSPSPGPAQVAPATTEIKLIGPDGAEVSVPASAKDALLAAGYTEPEPPAPEPQPGTGTVKLVSPDGVEGEFPAGAVDALMAAGYVPADAGPVPSSEPVPATDADGNFILVKDGEKISIPEAVVPALLAQGYEHVYEGTVASGPKVPEPADDDSIQFKLNVMPAAIAMIWKDAKRLFLEGNGDFVGDEADDYRAYAKTSADAGTPTAADGVADPNPHGGTGGSVDLNPALTYQGDDQKWHHSALDATKPEGYATKGGVTQALNRLAKQQGSATAAPATTTSNGNGNGAAVGGKEGLLSQARDLLKAMPELSSNFDALMGVFEGVSGKRNISEFDEGELQALVIKLEEMQATA